MTDDELRRRISSLSVPAAAPAARERAAHRALIAFANRVPTAERRAEWSFPLWRSVGLAAAVALVAALCWRHGAPPSGDDAKILAQVESLFPGQVGAVVERPGGGMDVKLTDSPGGASDQPLVIEFQRGADRLRVLSYSGRQICVHSAGLNACFEPLITGAGEIILEGDGLLWLSQHPAAIEGWKVAARTLPTAS